MRVRKSVGNDQQMAEMINKWQTDAEGLLTISLPFHFTNSYATGAENQEPPPCKKPVISSEKSDSHGISCDLK